MLKETIITVVSFFLATVTFALACCTPDIIVSLFVLALAFYLGYMGFYFYYLIKDDDE